MTDSEQGTPVGQIPVTGGRERLYANDAERARAWRERQKSRREDGADPAGLVSPVMAEASLAVLLDRLTDVGRAHEAMVGELIGRVEEAVGVLADPEAVAEALAGARAEAARQVAEAEERVIRASQAKAAAESAAREAIQARSDAEEAGNGAWERVETFEAALAAARGDLDTARSDTVHEARRHQEEVAALQAVHAEQLGFERRQEGEQTAEVREAARVAVEEANARLGHAEGVATELRGELEATVQAAHATLVTVRSEAAAARNDLAEQLTGRYQAELAAAEAVADAEITGAKVREETAREIAESRSAELTRLIAQVEDLRADLHRARHDP